MKTRSKLGKGRVTSALIALMGGMVFAVTAFVPKIAETILTADRQLGDKALYIPGKPEPREDLVLLGIDEDSLTLQGLDREMIAGNENLSRMAERFPWDRRVYADAIERLLGAGAKLVVIDLILSEESTPEADLAFASALAKHPGQVVLGTVFAPMAEGDSYTLIEPLSTFLNTNVPPYLGFVNFRPDMEDAKIREVRFSTTLAEENGYPPIPGEPRFDSVSGAVLRALGKPSPKALEKIRYAVQPEAIEWDKDGKVTKLSEPVAHGIYAPIPIRSIFIPDEWENRFASGGFFKDKIVLIGPGTARLQDNQQTPVGQILGPQLHLQSIAAGLEHNFVKRPLDDWRGMIFYAAVIGAFISALLIYFVRRPLIALTGLFLIISAIYLGVFQVAEWQAIWLGPTSLSMAIFLGAVSGQAYDLVTEKLERSRLNHQFRRFVSRDVADSLVNNPGIYQLAASGRKRRVVVLFSDIRGFTSLSEQVTPEQLFEQLNEYLSAMVKIIFNHNGTLDKFIGDAILAHWGALEDGEDSQFASAALAATKDMIAELDRLNRDWDARGLPVLGIGIGLHLGEVLAGEIGSEQRTEFGVIGDAVNLASRLEGMTKAFSCPWLSSGQFVAAAGSGTSLRRIAKVRVKGREEPVDLWTTGPSESARISYAGALAEFEAGDFDAALEKIEAYLTEYPGDTVAPHLCEHIRYFRELRPSQWDGIIRFLEK